MTAWRRLLHSWAGRLPTLIIEHDELPLFERSVVFHGRVPLLGEVTVYLHHYLKSDPGSGLHDHPWPWAVSVPLAGGYVEQRLKSIGRTLASKFVPRAPGRPYRLSGFDFHRVVLYQGRTSWSLFITGANRFKGWGFLRAEATPPDGDCLFRYTPHLNAKGSHTAWWQVEPCGRDLNRAPP